MIRGLHDTNAAIYVVTAGAGVNIPESLLMTPNASKWLVGYRLLYAQGDTTDFLGYKPERFCDKPAAIALALEAYRRACKDDHDRPPGPARKHIGLGITAAIASFDGAARKGGHRIHLAIATDKDVSYTFIELDDGTGEVMRRVHNDVADQAGVLLLQRALGWHFEWRWPGGIDTVTEAEQREVLLRAPAFMQGRRGGHSSVADMTMCPGTFNPIHDGHVFIANSSLNPAGVYYAIGLDPPHKEAPRMTEVLRRVAAIQARDPRRPVLLTEHDPLFLDKLAALPPRHGHYWRIVIGADTLKTILDPRWGKTSVEVLEEVARLDKGGFLVVTRVVNGQPITCSTVLADAFPDPVHLAKAYGFFTGTSGLDHEVSSTMLRNGFAPQPASSRVE